MTEEFEIPGRADRSVRPRSPGGGRAMNVAVADRRCRQRGAADCKRGRSRPKADRRRLRLLDLPAERHRDVLGAVCGLRGARARHRGRADRRPAVQSRQRRDRDRLSSGLELHLRTDVAGGQFATPRRHLSGCRGHIRARRRVSRARAPRVRRHDRPRRNAADAAPFCPPSSRSSAATGCMSPPD